MSRLTVVKGLSGDWETVPQMIAQSWIGETKIENGNLHPNRTSISTECLRNSDLQSNFGTSNYIVDPDIHRNASKSKDWANVGSRYGSDARENFSPSSSSINQQRMEPKYFSQIKMTPYTPTSSSMSLPPRNRSARTFQQFDARPKLIHPETELYEEYRDKMENAFLRQRSLPPSPRQADSLSRRRSSQHRKNSYQPVYMFRQFSYNDNGNTFSPFSPFQVASPFSPFQPTCPNGQFGYDSITPMQMPPLVMSPFPYLPSPMMSTNNAVTPGYIPLPISNTSVPTTDDRQIIPIERGRSRRHHSCICFSNGHHRSSTVPRRHVYPSSGSDENATSTTPLDYSLKSTSPQSPTRRRNSGYFNKQHSFLKQVGSVTTALDRAQSPLSNLNFKWTPPALEGSKTEDGYPADYADLTTVAIEFESSTFEYSENRFAKRQVLKFVEEAFFMATSLSNVAKNLKKEMDNFYGSVWHVIVGNDIYGSNISFVSDQIFHFKAFGNTFLIWKT